MDYVVERFHGRSLALAHSQEEIEELDLRNSDEKSPDEKYLNNKKKQFLLNFYLENLFDVVHIVCEKIE